MPERPPQPGNAEDANWAAHQAVSTLNVEVTIPSNILVIFGDFLIYHW